MFLSGVIEGFYGPPWSPADRRAAFAMMAKRGLETYLYCPKDDLHHRAIWRESYGAGDAAALRSDIDACHANGRRFLYGIGPGLDIRYAHDEDRARLRERSSELLALGADGVALLFDDIPDRLDEADLARWGSLAAAQADLVNETAMAVWAAHPQARVLFCPTPYCGRMDAARHGGEGYLDQIGETLHADIGIFWTGPEIVSGEIDVDHVREVARRLRRKPILWDNLHANDYDSRRLLLGPYSGRPLALRDEVCGILTNPNGEWPLNFVALHTLSAYLQATDAYEPRHAYLAALQAWAPAFDTVSGPVAFDDLVLLADCYYLPHQEGPRAEAFLDRAARALTDHSSTWRDHADAVREEGTRLRDLCGRLATLRDRALFHAINRRVWDLREEVDLIVKAVEARLRGGAVEQPFRSDFHLPRTYRGGTVARLQSLLVQHPDGSFTAAAPGSPA